MQTITVDMTPGFRQPTIHYSQNDVGTTFAIDLRSRFGDTLPASPTVKIQATKPSGFGFSIEADSVVDSVATFTTVATMTDEAGRFQAELQIIKDAVVIYTANFYMEGEANPHPIGTTDGSQETIIPTLTLLVERVEAAAASVLDMTVEAETLAAGSQATYSYDEDTNTATFGIPQGEAGAGAAGVTASGYSSSKTYAVGDYVIHNSNLYRCTTAITTAEAFTAAHWTQVVLGDDVCDLKSAFSNDFEYWEKVLDMPKNYIDCNGFSVSSPSVWQLHTSNTSLTITHLSSASSGPAAYDFTLPAGTYVFHATIPDSSRQYFTLYQGGTFTRIRDLYDGDEYTVSETTNLRIAYAFSAVTTVTVTDVSLIEKGAINRFGELLNVIMTGKARFIIHAGAINIDYTQDKISIPAGMLIKNNSARVSVSATELTRTNSYLILYYDLANSQFVTRTHLQATDLTNMVFVAFIPETATGNVVSDVPISINGEIVNREQKQYFMLAAKQNPIVIHQRARKIYFPPYLYVNYKGTNYNIANTGGFVFDYKGNNNQTLKSVYFDTSKLASAVSNGLSNDCFYVREQTASLAIPNEMVLIATIPDAGFNYNNRPVAIFDFITDYEQSRTAVYAKGFIPSTPTVHALYGEGAPVVADDYDQFAPLITLWDSLVARANQYGTYMSKCWMDGTAYDNTQKIMSDLPTSGAHNPRSDMSQYPLLMYKMIPINYNNSGNMLPNRRRILVSFGIHGGSSNGDHIESPIAGYYFAKRLVDEFYLTDSLFNLRNNIEIDILPCCNPWGINNHQRVNGQNVDINRDFSDFSSVTSQQIKALLESGNYDFYWDSHCLGGISLTEGDLAGDNLYWEAVNPYLRIIGKQVIDFVGAKYSIPTNLTQTLVSTSAAWYGDQCGIPSMLTEIPANTPAYYGDTIGDAHGEKVVGLDVDFVQNAFAVVGEWLIDYNA